MTVRGPPGRTEPRRPGGIVAASRPLGPGTVAARRHPGSYGPGTAGRTLQKQKHRPASLPLGRLRDIPADMAPQGRRGRGRQGRLMMLSLGAAAVPPPLSAGLLLAAAFLLR